MDEARERHLTLKRLKRHRWRLKHPRQHAVDRSAVEGLGNNAGIGATLADVWPRASASFLSDAGGAAADAAQASLNSAGRDHTAGPFRESTE